MCLMTSNAKSSDVAYRSLVDSDKPDTSLFNQYIKVDPFNLSILTPSSGVQFFKDGIIFLSSSKSEGKMVSDHLSFGTVDTRYAVLNNSVLESHQTFSTSSSFSYPSEAITFSNDYKTMYFTRYSKSDGSEKIYEAISDNQGNWSLDSNPMSFCTDNSTYTQPALSADGKLIVFASNRAGSIGGMDLFASLKKDGAWSDPVNLGDAVNSTSNELYPFLDSENNLFFSSDNTQGYGGYDIYVCKYIRNTWEKPINLSTPVNTRFDDVAFSINRKNGNSAFFTVKQKSDIRSSQLYQITMRSNMPDNFLTLSQYFTRPDISQMVILALEPAVQATDIITETASESRSENDIITYRVQFLTSFNPRTRSQITVSGNEYTVFEYLYSGAYRLCIGEFSTLSPAIELQNLLMKNDYPEAFVVVFKNNVISLDPELLEEQTTTGPISAAEQTVITEPESETIKAESVIDTIPETEMTETTEVIIPEPETKKIETIESTIPYPVEKKDVVVYRVQFLTNNTSKGSYNISINDRNYYTFEYFYVGAYRMCVGEFSTLGPAKELQGVCRKSGYPQAFVVAFKNNVRSTDPGLFK